MKKIKFQGGLTKLLTSKLAKTNKRRFEGFVEQNLDVLGNNIATKKLELYVVSFSSSNDYNEQFLSILSFLRYAGTPVSWTIYSDGSHSIRQLDLLKSRFEFLEVKIQDLKYENFKDNCKKVLLPYVESLLDYAVKFPLGKKLLFYLNHSVKNPTLFLDSDILFYNKASLFNTLLTNNISGWFLPDDDWGCLDSRYKAKNSRELYQVNSGFFLLNRELDDVRKGLDFLNSLNGKYEYFSEQTTYHILFNDNHLMPLDPRIFVLNSDDQFDLSYILPKDKMAMRHYTSTVRHKMWQRDWKWHLSLK